MNDILAGNFAPFRWQLWPPQTIRVVNWNIDRGLRLPAIADYLASQQADLLTLQEVDLNARRTQFRNISEDLARKLGISFVFGREFEELTQVLKTSPAYHGQATLSRWRLRNPRVIRFRRQSSFWRPRWLLPRTEPFQERLGGRIALVTEVDVAGKPVIIYNLHLESRGDDTLRFSQLKEALDDAAGYPRFPILLAGDLNFDISEQPTVSLFWKQGFRNVFRRSRFYTTPAHGIFGNPRSIDWSLVSRPLEVVSATVNPTVNASDHYPISFTLRFPETSTTPLRRQIGGICS